MTREKKEIHKKLEAIDMMEEADGMFGYWETSMAEPFEEARKPLLERLAKLSHFNSVEDMFGYQQSLVYNGVIPF